MGNGWHEWPLMIFTVFGQCVAGGFIVMALALMTGNLSREQEQRVVGSMFGLWVLMGIGFIASTMHLGSPLRAFNSLNRVGASSLSNEIASGAIFFAVGGIGWLLAVCKKLPAGLRSLWLIVTMVLGVIFVWMMVRVYNTIDTVPTWYTVWTPLSFFLTLFIGGPLLGGFLADHVGLRMVFFITAILLTISFLVTLFLIKEGGRPQVSKSERLTGKQVLASLPYPGLVISLFFTTLVIQLCNGSIGPILALFIKSMAPDSNNIAFLAGMIAAVPGVSALISAPRLGKLGDRIGTSRILLATLCCAVVMFFAMSFVTTPLQLGTLRFLLGFADGAMLPAVQTLLLKYSSDSVTGRIFGYNQSFMYLGNVAGPLIGASVSAMAGFRWVFIATAIIVFINLWQLAWMLRRTRRANA